jgi:uncharacterized protein YndB with AHSA1/START domain
MDASADLEERTLRMVHSFDASAERLFEAWTDPKQFVEWFGPQGMTNTFCELDMRVGGTWRVEAEGRGTRRAVSGKYLEIDPPRRLVFTWAWHEKGDLATPREHETTVALDFKPVGRRTELTLTQSLFRDGTGTGNHRWGWTESFEKLATFVSRAA